MRGVSLFASFRLKFDFQTQSKNERYILQPLGCMLTYNR